MNWKKFFIAYVLIMMGFGLIFAMAYRANSIGKKQRYNDAVEMFQAGQLTVYKEAVQNYCGEFVDTPNGKVFQWKGK